MPGLQEWAITAGSLGVCFPPWLGFRAVLTLFPFTPWSKPLVSGCKLWPPPQSWPGCQACSPHCAYRIFFKSVSQPPSQPSPLPRSHPPRAPWCALGQGWSFTSKARQTLLIHALMPLYPVTLRPARVSRTSLKASVSQESYNKI